MGFRTLTRLALNALTDGEERFRQDHGIDTAHETVAAHAGHTPRIAVLDTGVSPHFEAVTGVEVVGREQFNNGPRGPHGTEVASVATGANATATPPSVELLSGRVMDPGENATRGALPPAIRWAADRDADVIVFAGAGHPDSREAERAAVEYAVERGSVVLASVGNGDWNRAAFPARHPDVLAVGATDTGGGRVSLFGSGSNWPADVCSWGIDVPSFTVAPGDDGWRRRSDTFSGTSAAVAVATHAAALIRAVAPDLAPAAVRETLVETGDSVAADHIGPRVNAAEAVRFVL